MYDGYVMAKIHMVLIGLVLVGGINWLTTAFGYNFVDKLCCALSDLFHVDFPFDKVIYVLVGLAALFLAFQRSTWLPFLGKSVLPSNIIPLSVPKHTDTIVTIKTKPNSKIAYWAANPMGVNPDVVSAYGDFSNSGVVMSDNMGIAKLPILSGSGYHTPSGYRIERHVHYRILGLEYGMMGKIKTKYY
jgi:uncharacterized membrane protein YuzA (DUF378 family)